MCPDFLADGKCARVANSPRSISAPAQLPSSLGNPSTWLQGVLSHGITREMWKELGQDGELPTRAEEHVGPEGLLTWGAQGGLWTVERGVLTCSPGQRTAAAAQDSCKSLLSWAPGSHLTIPIPSPAAWGNQPFPSGADPTLPDQAEQLGGRSLYLSKGLAQAGQDFMFHPLCHHLQEALPGPAHMLRFRCGFGCSLPNTAVFGQGSAL